MRRTAESDAALLAGDARAFGAFYRRHEDALLGMEVLVLDDDALRRIDELAGEPASAALAELPPDQQDAVVGRVLEERDYAELAARLECSPSVVRQRVSRGLRALRARLQEDA